ncbi:hypothetical protein ROHU_021550 [Labeo rohita]|uniref:Uncharacterized protein n=1 Tax=Labeo rohita TaxID=84645 RepID=A0A498MU07_LABRO|nr:hypothetical protein ROHU_021550 [Labeo rohita]
MVVAKPKPGATSASGVRFALYKAYSELPDPSTLDPKAAYADFKPDSVHLICPMNLSSDKPLVDFIFNLLTAFHMVFVIIVDDNCGVISSALVCFCWVYGHKS